MERASEHACPAWVQELDFLNDAAVHADPYPTLARLRSECPVAHMETQGGYWIVTRHADVHRVLKDNVNFSNAKLSPGTYNKNVRQDLGPNLLIQSDPPMHWAYRQVVAPTFTPARAVQLESVTRDLSKRLLQQIRDRGECEFVHDFAIDLSGEAILPLIGVPDEDRDELLNAAWGEEQKHVDAMQDKDKRVEVMKATRARQVAYFRNLFETRLATGPIGDDLVSTLVAARIDGRPSRSPT
jgi:cytochrome P450